MKYRRTSLSMKLLAWLLVFVMMVPWNVLAEEKNQMPANGENASIAAPAPDDQENSENSSGKEINGSEKEETEAIPVTSKEGEGTVFSAENFLGNYTVSFYQVDPEDADAPENNLIAEYEGVNFGTELSTQIEKLEKEYPEYADVVWTVDEEYTVANNIEVWGTEDDVSARIGENTYPTLQAAIDAVDGTKEKDGSEILLLKDVSENISSTGKNYTLDMQEHTITPAEGSTTRVYTVSGGTVTLKNGTITGGSTADTGAGLAALSNTELTALNLTITGNQKTSGVGGGMYVDASTAVLTNCTVSNNRSTSDCGGILLRNGASLNGNNLTVNGNSAEGSGAWGGGISSEGASGKLCTLHLTNSNVIDNNATGYGGGIYMAYTDFSSLNTSISNNTSGSHGGGVYMTYSPFSAENTHIDYNTGGGNGGGLATSTSSSKNPKIEFTGSCTVSGNKGRSGGGLYVYTNHFTAENFDVIGNTATGTSSDAAGGIYLKASTPSSNPGEACLKNVGISDNIGGGTGGLYVSMGTGSQKNAYFNAENCKVLRNNGSSYGGAYIRVHSKDELSSEFTNCTFTGNSSGDTLYLDGAAGSPGFGTRYVLRNCRMEGNNASASGKAGGINSNYAQSLVLENTVITGNSGSATGGIQGYPAINGGAVYGNVSTDGYGANDLKVPFKTSSAYDSIQNTLSVPAASGMQDGSQSFAEYVWKDTNNKCKLDGQITADILKQFIEDEEMEQVPSWFYFTAGLDVARYVAFITDESGNIRKFETVDEAISAAESGDVIQLIAGEEDNSGTVIMENVKVPTGKIISVDMNGRTLMGPTANPAIEIQAGAGLTLKGTGSVETRYNAAYTIINAGTLDIADSTVTISGVDNKGGQVTFAEKLSLDTVHNQNGELTLAKDVYIKTLDNQSTNLEFSADAEIGTINNQSGSLKLSGTMKVDTIKHMGADLELSGDVLVRSGVDHQGDSCKISGNVQVTNITLAAGKYVTVAGGFNPDTLTFTIDKGSLKNLNTWGDTTVTLIAPDDDYVLPDNLAEKIILTGANALVAIQKDDETGNIVARTVEVQGVFVDGVKGDDTNTGTHDDPVKTFEKALELLKNKQKERETSVDGIYVLNTITVSDTKTWSFDAPLVEAGMKLIREPSFTGTLVKIVNGGSLTLSDITIDGMGKEGTSSSGTLIEVSSGGKLFIRNGAVLRNNKRTSGYGSGVFAENAEVVMDGGEISSNSGKYGGAVGLKGSSMTMNGGMIQDNEASEDGGGIAVLKSSKLTFNNGIILKNTAHFGGGISVGGSTTVTVGEGGAELTMNGGTISGNVSRAEGGGIYVQSENSAQISAGTIIGNKSGSGNFGGGGIYVNGTRTVEEGTYQYGKLKLTNALITGNGAERGGGLAGCSTSTVKIYQKNGAYIYGNTAENGADDIFISNMDYGIGRPVYVISEYMPDGTPYHWCDENNKPVSSGLLNENYLTRYLKNSITKKGSAAVMITGNTAANGGGGIGTNGFVQIGEPGDTIDIPVTKTWDDSDNRDTRPSSVKVWLVREVDGVREKVSLVEFKPNEKGEWPETLSFYNQPSGCTYTLEEEMPEDAAQWYEYTVEQTDVEDQIQSFTVTNRLKTDLLIGKKVVNGDTEKKFEIQVKLKNADGAVLDSDTLKGLKAIDQDGKEVELNWQEGTATITLAHDETLKIPGLPVGTAYEVKEIHVPSGYTSSVSVMSPAETGQQESSQQEAYGTIAVGTAEVVVTNTYAASGSWTPSGTKTLTGRDMMAGEFRFTVTEDGRTVAAGENTAAKAGEASAISFTGISYALKDAGLHTYVITEDQTDLPENVDGDSRSYTVQVEVKDQKDGTMKVSAKYLEGTTEHELAEFVNQYQEETEKEPEQFVTVTFSKTDARTGASLAGAVLRVINQEGSRIDEWTTDGQKHTISGKLQVGNTYRLIEVSAPEGYEIAEDLIFTVTPETEEVVMEDTKQTGNAVKASVTVTKKLTYQGAAVGAVDAAFYVALYDDSACTHRVTEIKPLVFRNASSSTVTFDSLESGKTYYAGETDVNGQMIESGIVADDTVFHVKFADGNEVKPSEKKTVDVSFENELYDIPSNFYREGSLTITKKVLAADGSELKSDEVFYAGIFADPEFRTLSNQVSSNTVALDLNGAASVQVTVKTALPEGETLKLYVTEVDENGTPVGELSDFGYEVDVDGSEISMDASNAEKSVTITNQVPEGETEPETQPEPESPEETEKETKAQTEKQTEASSVKTGDSTPIALYVGLLAVAAGMILILILISIRRRKGKR